MSTRTKKTRAPTRKRRTYRRVPRAIKYDGPANVTFSTLDTVQANATTDQPFALNFRLTDAVGGTPWLSQYDSYRIDKIQVKWIPILTTAVNRPYDDTTTPGTAANIPRMLYAIDRDGDDVGTITMNTMKARPNHKSVNMTKGTSITFTPTRLIPIFRVGATNAYKQDTASKQFIDGSYADVPHYGIIGIVENSAPANVYQYRREVKMWVTFAQRKY